MSARKKIYKNMVLAWFMTVVSLMLPCAAASEPDSYTLGVFPFLPSGNLEAIFAPVSAEISADIQRPVKMRLSVSYDGFVDALKQETFDIVHIHPFDYVRYGRPHGYIPLVARSEGLYAVFSVKDGSSISRIRELKGARVGTPPATGAVTYLALDALHKAGLVTSKNISVKNFPNHFACLQQLQIGSIDACATSSSTLKTFESQFGIRFKRIGTSVAIPHTLFAAHKRIPAREREQIRASLLDCPLYSVDKHLRELFVASADARTGSYFKQVDDSDYEPARRILKRLGVR